VNDDPKQGVAFQRPLCPFPKVAKFKGQGGSLTEASSFECSRNDGDGDRDHDDDHDHHQAENR
jgi:feruloyl esterase